MYYRQLKSFVFIHGKFNFNCIIRKNIENVGKYTVNVIFYINMLKIHSCQCQLIKIKLTFFICFATYPSMSHWLSVTIYIFVFLSLTVYMPIYVYYYIFYISICLCITSKPSPSINSRFPSSRMAARTRRTSM